ncbi:MAG: recombinase family protein, partial [Acidobacteriota bacterium]|nr:recombinase family protein [Acidobacteriota bacterium]
AGVRIFFYMDDRERTLNSPMEKVMMQLASFADELEREKARQRTYDAMSRMARAGHVTGGRVFGYDNIDVFTPGGTERSHVERRINEAEAAVVRRIFELCASGTGYARITMRLNEEQVPSPRPQQGRPAGWGPSTVYEVLHRPLYRGQIVWNQTRKRNRWGQTAPEPRPESEWLRLDRPDLRIVTEEAWQAAHARLRGIRAKLATAQGDRPAVRRDIESKYLLSGFARCATCGGTLSALSRRDGKQRAYFYGCLAHAKRGKTVCDNALVLPIERMDDAVLTAIAGEVLRPAVVHAVIEAVFEAMKPASVTTSVEALRSDLRAVDRKLGHLADGIATAGPVPALIAGLKEQQDRRDGLLAAIGAAEATEHSEVDREAIEAKVLAQVQKWTSLLTSHVGDGRQLLRELLDGPLRFNPEGKGYRFEGDVTTGPLIAGLVGISPWLASPPGFEPGF